MKKFTKFSAYLLALLMLAVLFTAALFGNQFKKAIASMG